MPDSEKVKVSRAAWTSMKLPAHPRQHPDALTRSGRGKEIKLVSGEQIH